MKNAEFRFNSDFIQKCVNKFNILLVLEKT